jgi:hypothetical protein
MGGGVPILTREQTLLYSRYICILWSAPLQEVESTRRKTSPSSQGTKPQITIILLYVYQLMEAGGGVESSGGSVTVHVELVSCLYSYTSEPVLLNVYGAPELMPRNEFRQPM